MYEMGAVSTHARSLWRFEHIRLKWSGGFLSWSSTCRLRHVTSGRYLALKGNDLVVVHRTEASEEACAFVLLQTKVRIAGMSGPCSTVRSLFYRHVHVCVCIQSLVEFQLLSGTGP